MSHEFLLLQKSMRESTSAILDYYVVFLHDFNLENWIQVMNKEYKSMQNNKVWEIVAKGYLRLSKFWKLISKAKRILMTKGYT